MQFRDLIDRLTSESTELKKIIDDLEDKNRRLVDKLNDQIYQKATEYKERTLQALQRSESPAKLRRALNGGQVPLSDKRLREVMQDENRPPLTDSHFRGSPNKLKSLDPSTRGITNYNMVKELEKMETLPHNNP